jgi:hypothetical protein
VQACAAALQAALVASTPQASTAEPEPPLPPLPWQTQRLEY